MDKLHLRNIILKKKSERINFILTSEVYCLFTELLVIRVQFLIVKNCSPTGNPIDKRGVYKCVVHLLLLNVL